MFWVYSDGVKFEGISEGEEFIVTGLLLSQQAKQFAQELNRKIASLAIGHPKSDVSKVVTVSVGLACGLADPQNYSTLCRKADQALYIAKQAGRNRIEQAC